MRILVAEDEPDVAEALRERLAAQGYDVAVERTGEDAFFRLNTETFDLILLDLTCSGRGGMEVLSAIRATTVGVLVLVLSEPGSLHDRLTGRHAGADDYLVKPFAFDDLLSRIRTLCCREPAGEAPRLTLGALSIDRATGEVARGSERIELTRKEFDLLEYLMRYRGQVVSRDALARDIWKEAVRSKLLDNIIEVHVGRLRRKVDVDRPGRLIHTVRGVGYILDEREPMKGSTEEWRADAARDARAGLPDAQHRPV